MNKSLRWLFPIAASIMTLSLSVFMAACGGDDDPVDETPAVLQSPADGETFAEGATVTLEFDKNPGTVTVNGNATEGSGKTRTFKVTQATNAIAWDHGGNATLTFTLTAPDETPPTLTESSPANGATDVDPAPINDPAGGITLTFNETISKQELMLSEGDDEHRSVVSVEDNVVTVKPLDPLVNETTYTVSGTVEDASANSTNVSVSFTTKAKD